MRIRHPGTCSESGPSPGNTLLDKHRTTRASSSHAPESVNASSVDRTSFDRSGLRSGQVRRFLGAPLGLGKVKIISTETGPETVTAPPCFLLASITAHFTASRQ